MAKSRLAWARIPTRHAVLLVRCVLASAWLVMGVVERSLSGVLISGYLLWLWKEERKQPVERKSERVRARTYATELKKWGRLMALCATASVICFSVARIKGENLTAAANNLMGLLVAGYWLFDRANVVVWAACYFSFVTLVVAIFGPFEINLR